MSTAANLEMPKLPDHYDWLVAAAQRAHQTAEAAPIVVEAVRRAEMAPEQTELDDLLA